MATIYDCLQPVDSSMFSRAGFSEDTWELLLEFKSTGEIRAYRHIAPEVADQVLSSPSLGKYFNSNIKGNSIWEFDILGADPSKQPEPAPKPKAVESLGVIDEDIKRVEPGWNGQTIVTNPSQMSAEALDAGAVAEHVATGTMAGEPFRIGFSGWKDLPADTRTDEEVVLQNTTSLGEAVSAAIKDQTIAAIDRKLEIAGIMQPVGEVMPAWTAPGSAAEALDLMAERETEIKAIIAANVSTGAQALTVIVNSEESNIAASETLKRVVSRKDTTKALLDPFRSVLYSAYTEAGDKVKQGMAPLEKGEAHIKGQITAWLTAQERLRQQKLREAQEAAEAEARRRQQEESERLTLAEVTDALDQGDEQRAQTLFDEPIQVPKPYVAPVFEPPPAKVEGQSTATVWKVDRDLVESDETGQAYIASITKLLAAVKNGVYPIEQAAPLLSWDFAACDKLAGALMAAFSVPGLQAAPATTLRVSRGRKKKG